MKKVDYTPRVVDSELDVLLSDLAAVAIEGAKGVGKTVTAERRANTVYALDRPGALELATADPDRLLTGSPPVLIDEWQRYPASWDLVRRAVDQNRSPGRFILTGSATPPAIAQIHTGAGRIVRVRMRPLALVERLETQPTVSLTMLLSGSRSAIIGHTDVGLERYAKEILASGFPGLRGIADRGQRQQLDGYIDRIIDREFPEMEHTVRNPTLLRRWIGAYAAATSTTASNEVVRDAATPGEAEKPAKATTQAYRDILQRLWIVDPVPAWIPSRNHLRRLGSASKHHLVDPALAARAIGTDLDALMGGRLSSLSDDGDATLLGQLFESLVTQSVRIYAQHAESTVGHLRTHQGEHEIDLIVEGRAGKVVAIEVKLARTISDQDVRHLHWLGDQIGNNLLDKVIVTTGPDAYRRKDGVAVVPAVLLGP
jgi:predicted AAA+ superfamily ATPase